MIYKSLKIIIQIRALPEGSRQHAASRNTPMDATTSPPITMSSHFRDQRETHRDFSRRLRLMALHISA